MGLGSIAKTLGRLICDNRGHFSSKRLPRVRTPVVLGAFTHQPSRAIGNNPGIIINNLQYSLVVGASVCLAQHVAVLD